MDGRDANNGDLFFKETFKQDNILSSFEMNNQPGPANVGTAQGFSRIIGQQHQPHQPQQHGMKPSVGPSPHKMHGVSGMEAVNQRQPMMNASQTGMPGNRPIVPGFSAPSQMPPPVMTAQRPHTSQQQLRHSINSLPANMQALDINVSQHSMPHIPRPVMGNSGELQTNGSDFMSPHKSMLRAAPASPLGNAMNFSAASPTSGLDSVSRQSDSPMMVGRDGTNISSLHTSLSTAVLPNTIPPPTASLTPSSFNSIPQQVLTSNSLPQPGLSSVSIHQPPAQQPSHMGPTHSHMGPAGDASSMLSHNMRMKMEQQVGGTTYYINPSEVPDSSTHNQVPINAGFIAYTPLPHHVHMKPRHNSASYFVADDVRQNLLDKLSALHDQPSAQAGTVPAEVDSYQNLVPLEPSPVMQKTHRFGYPSTVYKATKTEDHMVYCLRRIHGFRHVNQECLSIIEQWKKLQHSNIVQLRQVFTTKAFGDHSLCFVHDYHPCSETLMKRHFSQGNLANGLQYKPSGRNDKLLPKGTAGGRGALPEQLLWCYIVQLTSAVRLIHNSGLAARCIDPTKILVSGRSRLYVNCQGVLDVMTYDSTQSTSQAAILRQQQEDLACLGRVLLALACHSLQALGREAMISSLEHVTRHYTADLKHVIMYLLNDSGRSKNVNEIMPMVGARFYMQLDAGLQRCDMLEQEVLKEVECGRLFRLQAKLSTILDRSSYEMDSWNETGERYLLKLFRDYVYHMCDENGLPWMDMSHIIACLNKLDSGSEEKIQLMSSDSQTVLVVSYHELQQCIAKSFAELVQPASST